MVASAEDPMKLPKLKGSNLAQKQEFAASAEDPMKLARTKGSKLVSRSRNLLSLPKTQRNLPRPKAAKSNF